MKRKHRERHGRTSSPVQIGPRPERRHISPRPAKPAGGGPRSAPENAGPAGTWIYGTHAALAAIGNPEREIRRILVTRDLGPALVERIAAARTVRASRGPDAEMVDRDELDRRLPRGAIHQGIAVLTTDLPERDVEDVIRSLDGRPSARLLVLDQVTDPHNVGAILRSAAAFGVAAVVLPERHAPAASAVMAKAASGAMERVPIARVVNLARALDQLKAANIWCIGLDGSAPQTLGESDLTGRVAFVLGAEGEGLRRLTRERCDALARIPIAADAVESLNVSNAAAIALYELTRRG